MSTERFPRKQVERAFQKFEDYTDDVFSARFQTWDDRFSRLMCHCEQDPVMRVVTEPLRSNARVNIDEWYEAAKATGGGMIGSGSYKLPADKEDMAALLYKLLLMVHEDKIEIPEFCMHFFGETTFQDMVEAFNGQVLRLFTREATNRLRDLFESSAEDEQISADKLVAFHHHDNSVNFHAPVQCSNLAFGHSTVSDSSAEYKINEELASALKALKPLLHDVLDPQRDAVTKALELLIQGATDSSITKAQAEQATKTIVAHSPSIANRLKHIAGEFALHVGANGVVAGIMWALGVSAHYTSFSTPFRPDDTSEPSRTSPWVC